MTFSVLCEVVGLVGDHYVSPPPVEDLAAAASSGVESYRQSVSQSEPISNLICAIPHLAFEIVCEEILERVQTDQLPVGDLVDAAVESMISLTLDPHTYYLSPQFVGAIDAKGVVAGLGIIITSRNNVGSRCVRVGETCPLTVVSVLPDSPAEAAGMLAGDVIRQIDGQEVDQLTLVEAAAALAGQSGTSAQIEVQRDGATSTINLIRQELEYEVVRGEMVNDVGYIRLLEFTIEAQYLFHLYLDALIEAGARTLVIDLRDNPGGLLVSAVVIGSEFLASGLVLKTLSPTESLDYPVFEGGIATGNQLRLLVLVNSGSASAAEVLAGVLQERGRALVLGQPTYGKNTVQLPFELRNDGILRMTISEWTTPAGTSVGGVGVRPDVLVDFPTDLSPAQLVDLAISSSR